GCVRIFVAHVYHEIRAQLLADLQAAGPRAGQDPGTGTEGPCHRCVPPAYPSGTGHHDTSSAHQTATLPQPVHRGTGGHHQRRFLVGHGIVHMNQRVDIVDRVLGKAAIGGEAVGAMTLVDVAVVLAVVVAGRVHAHAAALALAATSVNFHGD